MVPSRGNNTAAGAWDEPERASGERDRESAGEAVAVSIIVPVYNRSRDLRECLRALRTEAGVGTAEIIVVDDASTDDSAAVAASAGVRCERLATNSGPAVARNHGARVARGAVLFFVDSDVVVAPDALRRVAATLHRRPDVAAVIGSYNASPPAPGWVSQYRNLLHHFVHQTGSPEASTFWTGCGAIRRSAFEAVGGFDEGAFARCFEDVELGYRLRRAGYRILLDKRLQVTHLKRWTLRSMIATDVFCRAVPWSRLILEHGRFPNDLNVRLDQRLSVALTGLGGACVLLGVLRAEFLALAALAVVGVVALNRDLFVFFSRVRGPLFACACVPLHLLYFTYSGASFLGVWMSSKIRSLRRRPPALGGQAR